MPRPFRQRERRDDAGRRPGLEREHGAARRVGGGHDPARGLHDRQRGADLPRVEPAADVLDVALHQRPHVGVDGGGGAALVFLLLSQDLARERDREVGQLGAEDLSHTLLVLGASVCVEQADRDGLDAQLAQSLRELPDLVVPQRPEHLPAGAHPLVHLEAQLALDERRRLRPEEVVQVRHAHAAQLEHVAEPSGRQERRPGAAALEDGVRRDGGAVHDLFEACGFAVAEELADPRDDRVVV